ncbi:MAG: hypothetical protein WBC73_22265, partial [Phormidesmis sp.]
MTMCPCAEPSRLTQAGEVHQRFLIIADELSPVLAEAIARNGPVTLIPHQETPFAERLCRAVAGQQLSVKAAQSIWGRVVTCADATEQSLIDYVESADADELRGCGLSGAKVKAVGAIAQAARSGQLNADTLSRL